MDLLPTLQSICQNCFKLFIVAILASHATILSMYNTQNRIAAQSTYMPRRWLSTEKVSITKELISSPILVNQ